MYIGQHSETSVHAMQSTGTKIEPSGKAVQLINIEKEEERKVDGIITGQKVEEN